jgi:hypothetical protein
MIPTADLPRRIAACVRCHVGAPAANGLPVRDVDHDLIAAGHPRLNFEYAAHLANMPHHWRDDTGPDSAPDFAARSWAIGQVVSAKSALDLLHDRAARAEKTTGEKGVVPAVWPEFSELDCFACHHDLNDDPWRRAAGVTASALGRPRLSAWYYRYVSSALSSTPAASEDPFSRQLSELARLMSEPRPTPDRVAQAAQSASLSLDAPLKALSSENLDAARVSALIKRIQAARAEPPIGAWDELAQAYLALVALSQSQRALSPAEVPADRDAELEGLRDYLRFPAGFDSPRGFDPSGPPPVR